MMFMLLMACCAGTDVLMQTFHCNSRPLVVITVVVKTDFNYPYCHQRDLLSIVPVYVHNYHAI